MRYFIDDEFGTDKLESTNLEDAKKEATKKVQDASWADEKSDTHTVTIMEVPDAQTLTHAKHDLVVDITGSKF